MSFLCFYKFIYFIYFLAVLGLRCWARAFSSCGEWGLLFVAVRGLLIAVASLCFRAPALGTWASVVVTHGLSSCGSQALEHRLSNGWLTGLVAPRHVGSSWTRAQTRVPCTGRQIHNHCTTREAQCLFLIRTTARQYKRPMRKYGECLCYHNFFGIYKRWTTHKFGDFDIHVDYELSINADTCIKLLEENIGRTLWHKSQQDPFWPTS